MSSITFFDTLQRAHLEACNLLVRALGYFSPKLVRYVYKFSKDITREIGKSHHLRPHCARFDIDGVQFLLDISHAAHHVQSEYKGLADRGDMYEPVMTRCLGHLVKQMERPKFMDVGAYMGYYACYVAALLDDVEPVYAIESNVGYCDGLRRSVSLNGFANLKVCNAILSDKRESAAIDGVKVQYGEMPDATGATVTLDDLCRTESMKPNIVKIDVHGTEGKILFGMQELMRESVEYLLLELHPYHYLEKYSPGVSRLDILTLFDDLGWSVFYVSGHRIAASQKSRECIRSGSFTYRAVTSEVRDSLLFDRQNEIFLLVSRNNDIQAVLGESVDDPFLC